MIAESGRSVIKPLKDEWAEVTVVVKVDATG